MTTKHAALLLLATAIGGQALLRIRPSPGTAPGAVAFHLGDTSSLARQRATERAAEVAPGETIDIDRAGAGELARLPGVGPGLARRIVTERAKNGPFGGSACLDARVAGVGEAFLRRAGPHLRYSAAVCAREGLPAGPHGGEEAPTAAGGCPEQVDLATARKAELECLPGVGPARADSILAFRTRGGGFRSVEDLREVPGVSVRLFERLRSRVRVGQAP